MRQQASWPPFRPKFNRTLTEVRIGPYQPGLEASLGPENPRQRRRSHGHGHLGVRRTPQTGVNNLEDEQGHPSSMRPVHLLLMLVVLAPVTGCLGGGGGGPWQRKCEQPKQAQQDLT